MIRFSIRPCPFSSVWYGGEKILVLGALDGFKKVSLVLFYRKDIIGFFIFHDEPGMFHLCVHSIGGDDPSFQVYRFQKGLECSNFVALFVHLSLSDDYFLMLQEGRYQVNRFTIRHRGATQRLAVNSHRPVL